MERSEVVVVVGACGGAGTSTVAALLARRRAARGRAVLADVTESGAGLDVLLGLEGRDGVRWSDLHAVRGPVDPVELSLALPRWQGVEVLAGPGGRAALPAAWRSICATDAPAATSSTACTVVVDVGTGGVPGVLLTGSLAVLVTGQDVRGVAGALRRTGAAAGAGADGDAPLVRWAGVVVRARPRARLAPLEVARAVGLPLLGTVPESRALADSTERGLGPLTGPWGRAARAVRVLDERLARGWEVVAGRGTHPSSAPAPTAALAWRTGLA